MEKNRIKLYLIGIGISGLVTNNIVLFYTFLRAYFHNYETTVLINKYGEAHVELIMLPVVFIISLWALHQLMFKVTIKKVKQ